MAHDPEQWAEELSEAGLYGEAIREVMSGSSDNGMLVMAAKGLQIVRVILTAADYRQSICNELAALQRDFEESLVEQRQNSGTRSWAIALLVSGIPAEQVASRVNVPFGTVLEWQAETACQSIEKWLSLHDMMSRADNGTRS